MKSFKEIQEEKSPISIGRKKFVRRELNKSELSDEKID